jgi:hypothetical protein
MWQIYEVNGIWSSRGDGNYEFTFDADHLNAPGVRQIELEENELLRTVAHRIDHRLAGSVASRFH